MKRYKVWLIIFLVFFAGIATGVVGSHIALRHFISQMAKHPDRVREKIERDLNRKLKLDADQKAKVHEVLVNAQSQIHDLRGEFAPRFTAILTNAETQISATLTPEQRERFDQYRERNERFLRTH